MAKYIDSIFISEFRGIKTLELQNISHVNIIAGDNNSGKTSILEAIHLLKDPADFYNVIKTSLLRKSTFSGKIAAYENFINMLPAKTLRTEVKAKGSIGNVSIKISGEMTRALTGTESSEAETDQFVGKYRYEINSVSHSTELKITPYTEFYSSIKRKKELVSIYYLSPADHFAGNVISKIVRSPKYKDLCVSVLQLFDCGIEDILYIKNDISNKPVECLRHKETGIMPLSTYGDGIKQVISLANAVARSQNGILMIDEIETSIHSKYYENIFAFVIKACRQYNIQLFVTTHSKEAIDALLAVQGYDNETQEDDPVSVITIRTDGSHKTLSRIMSGRDVLGNREKYDFEVRI